MSPKLYKIDSSPPSRAAMMACDIFKVPVDIVDIKMMEGEHLTPQYLKKNPLHTVPVFEEGDFIIHDSQAILMYLADSYGKTDSWYPKDTKKRALVNHKLFFIASTLFSSLRNVTYSLMKGGKEVTESQKQDITDAYGFVEEFLNRSKYIAGDQVTIADISALAIVSSLQHILPLDKEKHPKTDAWLSELSKEAYCVKWNSPGSTMYGQFIQSFLRK